jgi:hypothetical protein
MRRYVIVSFQEAQSLPERNGNRKPWAAKLHDRAGFGWRWPLINSYRSSSSLLIN